MGKRRAGLYTAARKYLAAHKRSSDHTTKCSLLFLAISAVREVESLPSITDERSGLKETEGNYNDAPLSQKCCSLSSSCVEKKQKSLRHGRVDFRSISRKDFPELIVPATAISSKMSFSIVNDTSLLEKRLEKICVMEHIGCDSHNIACHEQLLQGRGYLRRVACFMIYSY